MPEAARVLRPGGRLALAWNGVDRSVDWMRALWAGGVELTSDEQTDVDQHRRRRHVVNVEPEAPARSCEPESQLFRWTRTMTKDELIGMAATYSAVITMDDGARRAHLDAMRRYLDRRRPSPTRTSSTCRCVPTAGGPPRPDEHPARSGH